jgi:hypothetical protein
MTGHHLVAKDETPEEKQFFRSGYSEDDGSRRQKRGRLDGSPAIDPDNVSKEDNSKFTPEKNGMLSLVKRKTRVDYLLRLNSHSPQS